MLRNFIKTSETPRVIAEIGINHNGQLDIALRMIQAAYDAGAWAVKVQKRTPELVYRDIWNEPRDDQNPYGWTTQGEQKAGLEFDHDDYDRIDSYCRGLGIPWFASAWDLGALDFLTFYSLPYQKISSAAVTHIELLKAIAELDPEPEKIFMSIGGCSADEIYTAHDILRKTNSELIIMHCIPIYPCPYERVQLNRLLELAVVAETEKTKIGYSGHEVGILPSVMAMAWGAEYVERHITLDRSMYGSDQAASLEIPGLIRLIQYANLIQPIAGDPEMYAPGADELAVLKKLRHWE